MEKLNPRLAALFTLGIWFIAACTPMPERDSTVYISEKGARGTNPFSTSSGAPSSWKCSVPPGQYQVEDVDPKFDIIMVKNCWINRKSRNVSHKAPASTRTPYPTPNVWVRGNP
ncbi:MAG: hypothetical protein AAB441_03720 [Patescibacteria group bacterium]